MRVSSVLRQAQAAARTPMIRFIGKRTFPGWYPVPSLLLNACLDADSIATEATDNTPHVHPASPTNELPDSFMKYRSRAQQHGPLNSPSRSPSSSVFGGFVGGHTGASLGPVQPKQGEYFDRNELPERFKRVPWTQAEIEAIETGGASLFA
ncbi:hypothetical protein PRK78_000865 [Emydomyces testavorans]|uniref:Ribosomal protein S36, mitochondrial n=1 Tax=Emydomyces testavorans TaxID=2070801 RepID=A0AAF0DBI3_9EURO|nr:hypothetical protein PRK78_000865 [Emydomyces testavorans]